MHKNKNWQSGKHTKTIKNLFKSKKTTNNKSTAKHMCSTVHIRFLPIQHYANVACYSMLYVYLQKVGMYQNYYTNQAAMWQKIYTMTILHYVIWTIKYCLKTWVLSLEPCQKLSMMTIASVLNVVQPTIVIYLSH